MNELTPHGRRSIAEIAERHGFGDAAVIAMLDAIVRGNGSMAQFGHPEFGGTGQWMRGGMTMVSDMFDHGMKARVDALCRELAQLVSDEPALLQRGHAGSSQQQSQQRGFDAAVADAVDRAPSPPVSEAPSGARLFADRPEPAASRWWPSGFGSPSSTGSQNGMQYAYFASAGRLAIDVNGAVSVYDTGDHRLGGFSQQQSSGGTVSFTSQHGTVALASLRQLAGPAAATSPQQRPDHAVNDAGKRSTGPRPDAADALTTIEQMDGLRARGILTDEEFARKKAELLARL